MPVKIVKNTKTKTGSSPRKRRAKNVDWEAIRDHFFAESLTTGTVKYVSLRSVAKKFGVAEGSVYNRSVKEGWLKELEGIRERRVALQDDFMGAEGIKTEAEVRLYQAQVARTAITKGSLKLATVDPESLSVKEAIELIKLGLVEERKALGMADKFEFTTKDTTPTDPPFTPNEATKVLGEVMQLVSEDIIKATPMKNPGDHAKVINTVEKLTTGTVITKGRK